MMKKSDSTFFAQKVPKEQTNDKENDKNEWLYSKRIPHKIFLDKLQNQSIKNFEVRKQGDEGSYSSQR